MLARARGVARLFRSGLRHLSVIAGAAGIWTASVPLHAQPRPPSTDRIMLESRVEVVRQAMRLGGQPVEGNQAAMAQWGNWNNWNNWKNSWNNWGNWLNR